MRPGGGFLRGVSSGWFALLVTMGTQLWQVRWARNQLPGDEFALFNVISSLVMAFLIAELGVRAAFSRLLLDAYAGGEEPLRRLWSNAHGLFWAQSGIMLVLGLIVVPWVPDWFQAPAHLRGTVQSVFVALLLITVLQYAWAGHQLALLATQRFVLANGLTVLAAVVSFLVFGGLLRMGYGLWSYVGSAAVTLVVGTLGMKAATRWLKISRPMTWALLSWDEMKRVLVLGIDLFFVGLYNIFLSQSLLLFAGQFLPLAAIGVLAINAKLMQFSIHFCQRVPGTAETVLSRFVAEGDLEKFRGRWGLMAKISLLVCLAGAGGLYLWSPTLVSWWTSPADVMGGLELALLCLIPVRYIAYVTLVLPTAMFKATARLRYILLWEITLFTVLATIGGQHWGLTGLLIANLISLPLGSLGPGVRIFAELSGYRWGEVGSVIARSLLLPLVIFGMLIVLVPHPEAAGMATRFGLTAAWLLALGAWALLGVPTAAEKQLVLGWWQRRRGGAATSGG